jgi:hypothetical protein
MFALILFYNVAPMELVSFPAELHSLSIENTGQQLYMLRIAKRQPFLGNKKVLCQLIPSPFE